MWLLASGPLNQLFLKTSSFSCHRQVKKWREKKKSSWPKEWHSDVERVKPEEHYQTFAKKQQEASVENEDTKERVLQGLAQDLCPHLLIGIDGLPKKAQ